LTASRNRRFETSKLVIIAFSLCDAWLE
jgi:hypothetical protein